MKKLYVMFIVVLLMTMSQGVIAQPPPPPLNPSGGSNDPVGSSGAPVGDGVYILITLAAAYAGRKMYFLRTPSEENQE
jgi:hypothetical protein